MISEFLIINFMVKHQESIIKFQGFIIGYRVNFLTILSQECCNCNDLLSDNTL